eukprot:g46186.t1
MYCSQETYVGNEISQLQPFAKSIKKNVSLKGVIIPGSGGLQIKASLYMDDVTIFCLDSLSVHGLMNLCNQFILASGTKDLKVPGIWFGGAGACAKYMGGVYCQ